MFSLRRTLFSAVREPLTFGNLHGFRLHRVLPINELSLVAYSFVHEASGAKLYHVDIDDANNTFCIGFRTPARDNTGQSHILEHTVLCGSVKYPVRDPFFKMARRSLSTFMNALTGADYTLYPFSTTNIQDFQNLLGIYLDAVFKPLLRVEDFEQEGHRVEVTESAASTNAATNNAAVTDNEAAATQGEKRLVYNGVVFNEMRGVVSDPTHHFSRALMRTTLPRTHYIYESGGYPTDILQLTHDDLVHFHKTHYHPSNSITLSYGAQHPEACMAALDHYFAMFTAADSVAVATLPDAARFVEPQLRQLEGPLDVMGNPTRQKRISVAYAPPAADNELQDLVAYSVLDALLSRGPSSPMFKALIESQLGSEYAPMQGYAFYLSSPIISYGVAGVEEGRADAEEEVLQAVTNALTATQRDGFDPRRLQSVVFQEELQQRHRAADYGVSLCTGLCALGLCRSQDDPLDFINWLPHLRAIAADNGVSLLPRLSKGLLDNPHRVVVSVSAKADYLGRLQGQLREMECAMNAQATEADVRATEDAMRRRVARLQAPEDTNILPTLRISDVPANAFAEPTPRRSDSASHNALYTLSYPTNGLVYVHGLVPFADSLVGALVSEGLQTVSANLPMVHTMLGRTGAGPYSFKEQSIETELVCNHFDFQPLLNESYGEQKLTIAGTAFSFYTTKEKLAAALGVLRMNLLEPHVSVDDAAVVTRVLSLAKMHCSGEIQSVQAEGHRIAASCAVAQLTRRGQVREHWRGLSQSRHASRLLDVLQGDDADARRHSITELLREYNDVCAAIVSGLAQGTLWATCDAQDRVEVERELQAFAQHFTAPGSADRQISHEKQARPLRSTRLQLGALPEAALRRKMRWVTESLPIDTSFVGYAVPNGLSWGRRQQAALRVACCLLSNEYLHRRVREEGGAYGSYAQACLVDEVGGVVLSSYRDPAPRSTAQTFLAAGAWLTEVQNITQERVDEAKLRLIAAIDTPYAADKFGNAYFLHDLTQATKQRMRDELLVVTRADIVSVASLFTPTPASVMATLLPQDDTVVEKV